METPLTQREFDLWRESDEAFKRRLEEHITTQAVINLDTAVRVKALEVNQENAGRLSAKLSTVVAAAVSALIGGAFALIGGK